MIRDRVVQGALKLILEPIFEADFQPGSFGYRPQRTAHEAVDRVARAIVQHKTRVIDIDLSTARRPLVHAGLPGQGSKTYIPVLLTLVRWRRLLAGYHGTPFDILGIHQHAVDGKPSFVIRTFQPQALAVSVVRGDQACPMHRVRSGRLLRRPSSSFFQDIKIGMVDASAFAFVADGKNGLRVLQLLSPEDSPNSYGFSPRPAPKLIASFRTAGPALAISKGIDRDCAVDESGNQIAVFGRRGARPFNRAEASRLYMRDGKPYTVSDDPPTAARAIVGGAKANSDTSTAARPN